jgi:hypothetical protein
MPWQPKSSSNREMPTGRSPLNVVAHWCEFSGRENDHPRALAGIGCTHLNSWHQGTAVLKSGNSSQAMGIVIK